MTQDHVFEHEQATECHVQVLAFFIQGALIIQWVPELHFVDFKGPRSIEIHATGVCSSHIAASLVVSQHI